jgi:hypothetical protein
MQQLQQSLANFKSLLQRHQAAEIQVAVAVVAVVAVHQSRPLFTSKS